MNNINAFAREEPSKFTDGFARCPSDTGTNSGHRDERQLDQVVETLIYVATADSMLPSEALAALTKALGTLLAFTARRQGLAEEEVLTACQNAVADYAMAAAIYMRETSDADPAVSEVFS
ncbi:hypothetical protein [Bradyrhizobium lablabi]|uniref:hypothetical protein n=1 Tax=Bradyrhizobium lablabi TaxID=722472 RepID=UPI001BAD2A27|nr:hypothetical protein [Bradyrhizobium lablabi]MBR0693457.1 hypothetical protein [Bradyrhizobium lablabi]